MNSDKLSLQITVATVFVVMGDDKVISAGYAHGSKKGTILTGDPSEFPNNF